MYKFFLVSKNPDYDRFEGYCTAEGLKSVIHQKSITSLNASIYYVDRWMLVDRFTGEVMMIVDRE